MQRLPDFVRRLSPEMLTAYCASKEILFKPKKVKSDAPDERQAEFLAFLGSPSRHDTLLQVEADFGDVGDMNSNKGCQLLIQAARMDGVELPKDMEKTWPTADIAMWFFLNAPDQFQAAVPELALTQSAGWTPFKVKKKVDSKAVRDARKELTGRISKYFTTREGRGHLCKIDFIERDGYICAVANPENYTQRENCYDATTGDLNKPVTFKPPFRVYFLYRQANNVLMVKSTGREKQRTEIASIFTEVVLKQFLSRLDIITYDLNRLLDLDFPMVGELKAVSVTGLTVRYPAGDGITIALSTTYKRDHGMARLGQQMKERNIRPSDVEVIGARMLLTFENVPNRAKREKTQVTVNLTPTTCNLGCKPIDEMARGVLRAWNIQLHDEPEHSTAGNDATRANQLQPA